MISKKHLCALTFLTACATEAAPSLSQTEADNSWEEFRANAPVTWKEFRASVHRVSDNSPYIVDGDIAIYDEDGLRRFYDAWLADAYASQTGDNSALTVRNVLGTDVIWPSAIRDSLTYCVSNTFGSRKAEVVAALGRATRSWSDQIAVRFSYRPDQDATCTNTNNNVLFNVSPSTDPSFFAAAFFPDDPRAKRQLLITSSAFTTTEGGRDLQGILRHETGHTLGFRHEHIHIACTSESTSESRQVTSYDVNSVMHYPQCRPSGIGGYRQTVLDFTGAKSLYGNAPRTSDILFRNVSTGQITEWLMSNGNVAAAVALFTQPAEWQIQATGDFNGDRTSDIIFRNVNTGQITEWIMANGSVASAIPLFPQPAEWQITAVGDFNGDGTSDILFRNTSTGQLTEWTMLNGNVASTTSLFAQPTAWQIHGVGDLNNDGTSDILWRNVSTGQITEWTMVNGNVGSTTTLFTQPAEWQITAVGDFNGDGTSDILFRNTSTGQLTEWTILNGNVASTTSLFTQPVEWQIHGVGDFNSDGTSDILFRNISTGAITEWIMANGNVGAAISLFAQPAAWQIHGVGDFNGQ